MKQSPRPVYLNLPKLASAMSITAKVSILHRVSGVLMFFALPLVLYFWQNSLDDAQFYSSLHTLFGAPLIKIIYIALLWALIHHVMAGIRFLLLDLHCGIERKKAQFSARLVMVMSILLTLVLGILIW